MKTIPVGPFLGINNRLPDTELRVSSKQSSGNYFKSADNIDVDNAGNILSRLSDVLIQAMTGAHSLFMVSATSGLLVRASTLYAITLPAYAETLVKVLTSNDRMTYAQDGDSIYCSNGTDAGRVSSGQWYPLGLPTPDAPLVGLVAGTLAAGTYQVGLSYCNTTTGEEGGVSPATQYELAAAGGLSVSLPAAVPGATHVAVYLSGANGEVRYLSAVVAVGAATHSCTAPAVGREAPQRLEAPLPAGELFMSNGRLCSFKDKMIYVGLPFRYGYYLPGEGYIPFTKDVTIAIENEGGTYVCADKTYFFPGDLGAAESVNDLFPFGGVRGTGFRLEDAEIVGWFSPQGFVLVDKQGQATTPMADRIKLTAPDLGCTALMEGEYTHVVACGWNMNIAGGAATTYSGFDFTSISGGYGTRADGIYQLGVAGDVDCSFNLGRMNFGAENEKHLPTCYAGFESEQPLQLRIQTPKGDDYTYSSRGAGEMDIRRFDTGKGLKANWFELSLTNSDGAAFKLSSLSFAPIVSTRRI